MLGDEMLAPIPIEPSAGAGLRSCIPDVRSEQRRHHDQLNPRGEWEYQSVFPGFPTFAGLVRPLRRRRTLSRTLKRDEDGARVFLNVIPSSQI
jgi:hypothetical protein